MRKRDKKEEGVGGVVRMRSQGKKRRRRRKRWCLTFDLLVNALLTPTSAQETPQLLVSVCVSESLESYLKLIKSC